MSSFASGDAVQLGLISSRHSAGGAGGSQIQLEASGGYAQTVGVDAVDLGRDDIGGAHLDTVTASVGIHQLIADLIANRLFHISSGSSFTGR